PALSTFQFTRGPSVIPNCTQFRGAVPRHAGEQRTHGAEIGETGEGETEAGKSGEENPARAREERRDYPDEDDEARAEPNMAFEGPATTRTDNNRESGTIPGVHASGENGGVLAAGAEEV